MESRFLILEPSMILVDDVLVGSSPGDIQIEGESPRAFVDSVNGLKFISQQCRVTIPLDYETSLLMNPDQLDASTKDFDLKIISNRGKRIQLYRAKPIFRNRRRLLNCELTEVTFLGLVEDGAINSSDRVGWIQGI